MKPMEINLGTRKLEDGCIYVAEWPDGATVYENGEDDMIAHLDKIHKATGMTPKAIWKIETTKIG